jgi:GxxExxY protein
MIYFYMMVKMDTDDVCHLFYTKRPIASYHNQTPIAMIDIPENHLAHTVIGLAIEIHKALGPGLHEDAYKECLLYELKRNGIDTTHMKPLSVNYKDLHLENGYTIDLVLDEKLAVEIETCDQITDKDVNKMLRNMKLGNYRLGLIINFNSPLLKNGIRRVANHRMMPEENHMVSEYARY